MRTITWCTILLLLAGLISCEKTEDSFETEKKEILVRKIGHEISKYIGDSIQGLKPVKEIEKDLYQIEFNLPFAFFSDSVINIIDREMRKNGIDRDYIVKVEECASSDVIFSYFVSPIENNDSVVPCLGRNQEEECYFVNIGFMPSQKANYSWLLLLIVGPLILGLIIFGFWQSRQIGKDMYEEDLKYNLTDLDNIPLGLFGFNFQEQYLHIKEERIELTYKEAKLMKILTDFQGKVVTREEIQQEVWDDDGSMISRSLDMFISKLRKKLKRDPNVEIKSIHGIGYKLIVS
jgi:hypothetical protein